MINLNTAAAKAAPAALGGVPEPAAGDFLAMLAGIVGNVTSAASADGEGVLLPGSPLLTDGTAAGDLADLAAELGTILDVEVDAEVGADAEAADGEATGFPWPTVQALAAMFAQPPAPTGGNGANADARPADPLAAVVRATGGTVDAIAPAAGDAIDAATDLAGRLTAMIGTVEADTVEAHPVATDIGATASAATASAAPAGPAATAARVVAVDAAAETATPAARTDRTAAPVGSGTAPTTEAIADRTEATVLDAAAESDAGEPVRVDTPHRGPDAEFRTARTGTADTLAEQVQATGELRETGGSVRDRGPITSTAAGVARVLDAIEQLEKAPPPRQVTLELGEVRVRVAVEDGAVRMQLLGDQRDAGRDFLRAANEALRERGFEMAGDGRGDARDRDADQQRPDLAPPRPERGFGRASRTTDPTPSGARTGIHL